jgi:hypothetical protein
MGEYGPEVLGRHKRGKIRVDDGDHLYEFARIFYFSLGSHTHTHFSSCTVRLVTVHHSLR